MQRVSDHHHNSLAASELVTVVRDLAAERERHRRMLVISVAAIILSFLLVIRSDGRVALSFLPGLPAPETCFAKSGFGIPCPGCGLTRSFISLAHGDWAGAWGFHRLGWLLAAATVVQIPYRLWGMAHPDRPLLGVRWPRIIGVVLIVGLMINFAFRWCGL